jgi:hypothetical protein
MILAVLVLSFTPNKVVASIVNLVMLALFAGVCVSSYRVGKAARRDVEEKYGEKAGVGVTMYAAMRAMQPRRMRRPPPKVLRGGAPR